MYSAASRRRLDTGQRAQDVVCFMLPEKGPFNPLVHVLNGLEGVKPADVDKVWEAAFHYCNFEV